MIRWIISFCKGWYKFLFLPKSELSKNRLKICNLCKYKKGFLWWSYCGECTCPLDAKTESELEECPRLFWGKSYINGGFTGSGK